MIKSHIMDIPLFRQYLKDKVNLAESSIYAYGICIGKFLKYNPDLANINDYNDFLIKVMIKKRSSYYYSAVRHFIDFKIEETALRNKLKEALIKPPPRYNIKRERKYLPEEQIIEVINNMEKLKHRIIAIVQTLTGVRAGDILRLQSKGIVPEEYEGREVLKLNLIGKGGKAYRVHLHDKVAQDLLMEYTATHQGWNDFPLIETGTMKNRKGNTNSLFSMQQMNYRWYWEDLKTALNTSGVNKEDFATHDFRRCFARRAWEKYKDIHILQSLLNHEDPRVTLKYLDHSGLKNIDYYYEMQK